MLARYPAHQREAALDVFLDQWDADYRANTLPYAWRSVWARPSQLPPSFDEWVTFMIRAGRGFGKTVSAAQIVRERVNSGLAGAVVIIAANPAEARDVMIEGDESGLLAVHPPSTRPEYFPSKRLLVWPNGAKGYVRSAEKPDGIRGLNADLVWGDEPGSWRFGREAWDMAMLALRRGKDPKAILTGTPKPWEWLRELEAKRSTVVRTGSTWENAGNLSPTFLEMIIERYAGTRLGLQEIEAHYLEDVEGALWTAATIEATRFKRWARPLPDREKDDPDEWQFLADQVNGLGRESLGLGDWSPKPGDQRRAWRTVVAVDPPAETAECGIVVASAPVRGKGGRDHAAVLADRSMAGRPEEWASQVVRAYREFGCERVVVEKNQGGDMTRATIHNVDPTVKVEKIHAGASKAERAEPVAALYARGWVHHIGDFPALESQMTTWVQVEHRGSGSRPTTRKSPDRLDALVHAINALLPPMKIGRATASAPLPR